MRYFNWKLAIVLVMGTVILAGTAVGLRYAQVTGRAERAYTRGMEAYGEKQWTQAARELGRYITRNQEDIDALFKYADAQSHIKPRKASNVRQAIAAYRDVLHLDKNHQGAVKNLTELYLGTGQPGEARIVASRYLETHDDAEIATLLAVALAALRQPQDAMTQLVGVVERDPNYIKAYTAIGQLTEQRPDDFEKDAIYWYDLSIEKNPAAPQAYLARARYYIRTDDLAQARADIEKAAALDNGESDLQLGVVEGYIDIEDYDAAEQFLNKVSQQDPSLYDVWKLWARIAYARDSKEKMRWVADQGIENLGEEVWDFLPLAVELYIEAESYDQAQTCLNKLEDQDIRVDLIAFFEGVIAEKKGQLREAVSHWQRAMSLGYTGPKVRLLIASAMSRLGDPLSVRRQLELNASEQPSSLNAQLNLLRHLARMGDWSEAKQRALRIQVLSPGNMEARLVDIEADIRLLSAEPDGGTPRQWAAIKRRLDNLPEESQASLNVLMLKSEVAARQGDFETAETLLENVKLEQPVQREKLLLAKISLLRTQGKIDQAVALLNDAIQTFPQSVQGPRWLAMLYAEQGERDQAIEVLADAQTRMSSLDAQQSLGLLLSDLYRRWDEPDKALGVLTRLEQKLPDSIETKRAELMFAEVYQDTSRAQALVDAIKAEEGEEGWQWRYEQAKLWSEQEDFQNQQYTEAVALLKQNLTANANDQASRVLLARIYEKAGENQLAVATYREALDRSPDDLSIILPAISAMQQANEFEQADELTRKAVSRDLSHPQLDRYLLQSFLRQGDIGSAINLLETYWQNDPNNTDVGLRLALLKIQDGRFDQAGTLLEQIREKEPDDFPVDTAKVQLLLRQEKYEEALQLCDRLVQQRGDADAYVLRSRTRATVGRGAAAVEDFNKALEVEPDNAGLWAAKSVLCQSLQLFPEALQAAERGLSLDPNNMMVVRQVITLDLLSRDPNRVTQAETLLDQALEKNPNDLALVMQRVRLLLIKGDEDSLATAQDTLEGLTRRQPKAREPWIMLAELLLQKNEPGKAIDVVIRGLANINDDKQLLLLKARAEGVLNPMLATQTLKIVLEMDPNDISVVLRLARAQMNTGRFRDAATLLRANLGKCPDAYLGDYRFAYVTALLESGQLQDGEKLLDALGQEYADDSRLMLVQLPRLIREGRYGDIEQKMQTWVMEHPDDMVTAIAVASRLAAEKKEATTRVAVRILRRSLANHPEST